MEVFMNYQNNLIETLISVFTVENGYLKVLLLRKKQNHIKVIGLYQKIFYIMMKH